MTACANAPAALRNRAAILSVLQHELQGKQRVLEIGSGTGQHAVYFAAAMPLLEWQTSDLAASLPGIREWIDESSLKNVREPLELDVRKSAHIDGEYDAVFSANTAHIMDIDSVQDMIALAGRILTRHGQLVIYGPFMIDGAFTSESNAAFDRSLQARDPKMGIRDLEWLDELTGQQQLTRTKTYAMPANNFLVVWQRHDQEKQA